jgi:hypothetical protein
MDSGKENGGLITLVRNRNLTKFYNFTCFVKTVKIIGCKHNIAVMYCRLCRAAHRYMNTTAECYIHKYYAYIHTHTYTYLIHTYTHIYIHYIKSHYVTLHYITLRYVTLHCIALNYITLHYITLHYITLIHMFVTKSVGCGKSHKDSNIRNIYSVKYY